ncbi:TPA: sel1 repeat family protein, partial [Pseudomonas aeruginosa]|nr:sel1 repeat family protein [Pseudomonas aeruginosa]HCE8399881.1 sel1 repeat family protein [Pseudomonas aeruginosa]
MMRPLCFFLLIFLLSGNPVMAAELRTFICVNEK